MAKPVVLSGLKPSGKLHIGNYLGMLKQAVELQESGKYKTIYCIVDYHSLTLRYDPQEKKGEIFEMVLDALSAGIDPEKSIFFIQSHVPEHANLAWIFNTITSMGNLERMVEYKEKVAEGQVPNAGLFTYPTLMAADILIYKAAFVPVGDDQRQHMELTREIVRTFSSRFGEIFDEPKTLHTPTSRVMSLDDPFKKMSKSVGKGCIFLDDTESQVQQKVKRALTDSIGTITYDPKSRPAISNLILIYAGFSQEKIEDIEKRYNGKGYAEFKSDLAQVISKTLTVFQKRKAELRKDKKSILKLLERGASQAQKIAQKTFAEVRRKAGLL